MTTETYCRESILDKQRQIDRLRAEIDAIASEHIPDFHFIDYKVSTFWRCDASPIGMCVFVLNDRCEPTYCRYCQGPVSRK